MSNYPVLPKSVNTLDELTDTTLATIADGEVLTYDFAASQWKNIAPVTGVTDHFLMSNIGVNTHVQIDSHITTANAHIADGTIHFTQAAISITESQISDLQSYLLNITAESIKDLSDVFTTMTPVDGQVLTFDTTNGWQSENPVTGVTDHTLLSNIGTNTHAQIDTHIADGTIHFTQAAISITESQISDLGAYITGITGESIKDLSDVFSTMTPIDGQVLTFDTTNGWQAETSGSGTSAVNIAWDFSTITTTGDPGVNTFRYNNAIPASITEIYVNDTSDSGADASTILSSMEVGDQLYIQQSDTGPNYLLATIVTVTDNTGWWTIVVTIDDSGVLPVNAQKCGFLFLYSAAGISDHTLLSNIGVNTHAQIETHIADGTLHYKKASI